MIEVIGAGLCRTGTNSIKEALNTLGFSCHHMLEVYQNPTAIDMWTKVDAGEKLDWDEVYKGYTAAVDFPTAAYYATLVEKYPEAKVVLTVRDPEQWYASVKESIYAVHKASKDGSVPQDAFMRMANSIVWEKFFQGRFEDKEFAISILNQRTEEVRMLVPKDRLLEFQPSQGWAPLCAFLGKPVPDVPFPHTNKREEIQAILAGAAEAHAGAATSA